MKIDTTKTSGCQVYLEITSQIYPFQYAWAFLAAQMVKIPSAMQETWVQFLGWKDPLEEGMATHSSILTWRIPWTEEPGGLPSIRTQLSY